MGRQKKIKEPIAWDYLVCTLMCYQVKYNLCHFKLRNFNWKFPNFYVWSGGRKYAISIFLQRTLLHIMNYDPGRSQTGSCFSYVPHPLIIHDIQGDLGTCSVEVGAGEEQRDISAAEGPKGTDSQCLVSMAVLWKPGSASLLFRVEFQCSLRPWYPRNSKLTKKTTPNL